MSLRLIALAIVAVMLGCGSSNDGSSQSMAPAGGRQGEEPPGGAAMGGSMMGGNVADPFVCKPRDDSQAPNQLRLSHSLLSSCQVTVTRTSMGMTEEVSKLTYNEAGYLVLEEYSSSANGMVNRRVSRSVDGQGRILRIEEDRDGDSIPDTRIVYTYDAATPPTVTALHDENADGMSEFSEISSFDSNGMLLKLERRDGQTDMLEYSEEYTYNEAGQNTGLIRKNSAMMLLREEIRVYDALGRLISVEVREGQMRTLKQGAQLTYQDMPCQRQTVTDVDGDEVADGRAVENYDDLNRITERRVRAGEDGPESTTTFTYDGDQLAGIVVDANGDGTAEQSEAFSYDPQGRLKKYTRDESSGDAVKNTVWSYSYLGCE